MHDQERAYRIPRKYTTVGDYLKGLRLKAGMTQREVGETLGYSSAQFISNFERGISLPPLKKLRTLVEMYGGSVSRLIELTIDCERTILAESLAEKRKRRGRKKGKYFT